MPANDPPVLPRILAVLLGLVGLVVLYLDVVQEASVGHRVVFDGPHQIGDHTLRLRERAAAAGVSVDILFGAAVIAGTAPVPVVADASPDHYTQRYGSRYALLAPATLRGPWHLLELSIGVSGQTHRKLELNEDGRYRVLPLGPATSSTRLLVPAPTLILLAIALLVARGLRTPFPANPTVLLVLLTAAAGAFLAWPIMLNAGIAQALPAAALGLAATVLVALAGGPRAQRWVGCRTRLQRLVRGALIACLLLGVFVAVTVNVHGFITPVLRPPGQALSPGDWFMQDFIMPTFALTFLGLLPALIGGSLYGLSLNDAPAPHA